MSRHRNDEIVDDDDDDESWEDEPSRLCYVIIVFDGDCLDNDNEEDTWQCRRGSVPMSYHILPSHWSEGTRLVRSSFLDDKIRAEDRRRKRKI
mmetsp:Transcript_13270/g.32405  ORF Transcript_13270/g.32405 Transcript_13270/m.32405 type:complete len:93 (+) Transcript_13270:220-498(+)